MALAPRYQVVEEEVFIPFIKVCHLVRLSYADFYFSSSRKRHARGGSVRSSAFLYRLLAPSVSLESWRTTS